MLLTQQAVHAPGIALAHRRHPSAPPAVVVQPTQTPGLLSLSKPPRSTPSRAHRRSPKAKPAVARAISSAEPSDAEDKPSPRQAPAAPSPAISERPARGRSNGLKTPKDKSNRSTSVSQSRAQGRRTPPAHLSSPPQAEAKKQQRRSTPRGASVVPRNPDSNTFDPFLASASDKSDAEGAPVKPVVLRSAPKLSARPNGRLARRRNQPENVSAPTSPLAARAVPVPVPGQRRGGSVQIPPAQANMLSRSGPPASSTPRPPTRRVSTQETFPICDDLTDAEDNDSPACPAVATWQQALVFDDGPRTAPLTSNAFNFVTPPRTKARNHYRAPSEGVFGMPMDEELADEDVFYGLTPARLGAIKYANSKFQSAPTPDALPAPRF